MSHGYASRLSAYPNKGVVGLPERFDSKRILNARLAQLAQLVQESSHLVILTGAGISTSANIPDFRGPKGIWTLEKKKQKKQKSKEKENTTTAAPKTKMSSSGDNNDSKKKNRHENNDDDDPPANKKQKVSNEESTSSSSSETTQPPVMEFSNAQPTLTHRAITFLAAQGKLQYCITQNVDGLHRRSGLSRDFHSSVHGCVFTEKCHGCLTEYFRDEDVGGMSFQPTGRTCGSCGGNLHDTLLDWEDALPELDFETCLEHAEKADLMLCLGTSLRIQPVGNLPLEAERFVIVNLQDTPLNRDADLVIRAPVDDVMNDLLRRLGYPQWESEALPPIERQWSRSTNNNNGAAADEVQEEGNVASPVGEQD